MPKKVATAPITLDQRTVGPALELASQLGVSIAAARGHWTGLCLWMATRHPDGKIAGLDAAELARAADYPVVDAQRFADALVACCDLTKELTGWDRIGRPAKRAAAKRTDQANRREGNSAAAWSAPYAEAWTAIYGGTFQAYKNARDLKALETEHGRDEVLRRWTIMLRQTRHEFACGSLLRRGWGTYEGDDATARTPRYRKAAKLYELIRTHGLFTTAGLRANLARLAEQGIIESADSVMALLVKLDPGTIVNARTAEFAVRHIEERCGDSL